MKAIAVEIANATDYRVAEVKDGRCHFIDGVEIPKDLIMYQEMPEDGFYRVTEATCGGACRIGDHGTCGMYDPKKCSVYSLTDLKQIKYMLSYDQISEILRGHL